MNDAWSAETSSLQMLDVPPGPPLAGLPEMAKLEWLGKAVEL